MENITQGLQEALTFLIDELYARLVTLGALHDTKVT